MRWWATILCSGLAWGACALSADAGAPHVTSKTRFRIPFKSDAATLQKFDAQEMRLFVSDDRGVTWKHTLSVPPDAGRFEYQAPGDGEYWFAVKTVDSNQQLHPPGRGFEPGLVVIVDTDSPRLDLTLQPVANNRVQLAWHTHDANLDETSLKLEYSQPGVNGWQPVSIVPQSSGQTAWTVPQGGTVAVRGSVLDKAGNSGRSTTQIEMVGGDGAGRRNGPDLRQPIAEGLASPQLSSNTSAPVLPGMPSVGDTQGRFVADHAETRPDITTNPYPRTDEGWDAPPNQTASAPSPPVMGPGYGPVIGQSAGAWPTPPGTVAAQPTIPQRLLNQRKFHVAYQTSDIGPSGLGGVELFITQDNGRKWYRYGEDPDRQSPFDVEVPYDGTFGFCIRARSGAGLSAPPPSDGDRPSVIVTVDRTPPQLEMLPVEQGTAVGLNQLTIRWRAADQNPADRSIALQYATNADGPWQAMTDWQADTGSHVWNIPGNGPASAYIRIMARDAAGNVSIADTPRAVVLDMKRPSAQIVDIEGTTPH